MEIVFLKLLNMSIAAGWMILAVMVLRMILKKAPKAIRCFMWALVAVRLLCPFHFESTLSLIPSAETVPENIMYEQEPTIHTGVDILNHAVNPVLSESLAPAVGDSANPLQVLTFVASVIWIAGLIVMVMYATLSYLRIRSKVGVSLPLEENIYLCDYIDSPFILGIFKPGIYIPSSLPEDKIAYVVAHEKAHLKRHDHWWKPLGFALLSVYWFHPLIWVAYVLLCRDIELACDEKVIKELGEGNKKSYSDALLYCSVPRKMIVACPLAFGEVGVKERVRTVLSYKKPAFWVILVAVAACIVVAVCFLTNPEEEQGQEVFGHIYAVEKSIYVGPQMLISSIAIPIEQLPNYCFTDDYVMFSQDRVYVDLTQKDWVECGTLQEARLSESNFDAYFEEQSFTWIEEHTAKELRKDNHNAWQLISEQGINYYLLQQKDGKLYLALWEYNREKNGEVQYLYQLKQMEGSVASVLDTQEAGAYVENQSDLENRNQESQAGAKGQGAENTEQSEADILDTAIRKVILGSDYGKNMEDVMCHTAGYVILGTEEISGTPTVDSQEDVKYLKVYARVRKQSFVYEHPTKALVSNRIGDYEAARIITFRVEADGGYELIEYWDPESTGKYYTGVKDYFPDDIEDAALDDEMYSLMLRQDCYEQAIQYGNVDTDVVVADLLEQVMRFSMEASDPHSYLEQNYKEHRELTYYGRYTLRYCFQEFLKGGQTGLRGSIMAEICKEIGGGFGEDLSVDYNVSNGQEWFHTFKEKALVLQNQYDEAELLESYPVSWMLLEMMEE
ncbi:MAG: hypothetical protein IJ379_11420 [Lachnospiraceae bacterium]|nr:hypothetical protein [Lachnospiraceae bacterium]